MFRRLRGQLGLLRRDPEKFFANLQQIANPPRFRERLLDLETAHPLHLEIVDDPTPSVNVLRAAVSPEAMTGGPNTVLNLAFWLAVKGVPVRLILAPPGLGADIDWFWRHLATVTGCSTRPLTLSIASAHDPARPLRIGRRDAFLATHWTTAQQVKELLPRMAMRRFFYLIQDFEPGFYPWSANYARALETYSLDHVGIFNEHLLFDYFVEQRIGRYADPAFASRGLAFEPAVDRALFRGDVADRGASPRQLLFYARPSNPRNLFGLGYAALTAAISQQAFGGGEWEFLAIGSRGGLPEMPLPNGRLLRPAPWAGYAEYARLLRRSDILLAPMLSPHTSYPVLEMAACGGIVVTNSFANKSAGMLESMSPNIIAVPPTEEGFAMGLGAAAARVRQGSASDESLTLPASWQASLAPVAIGVAAAFREMHQVGS